MKTMSILTDNIFQIITNLVPASVKSDITSFTFYDNHPRDTKTIDITVCTKTREVKEFHQRDLISSIYLDTTSIPTQIDIFRNNNVDLFYLVRVGRDLIILSRKEKLKLHKKIPNVDKYHVEDATCTGIACLRVLCYEDALPLVFDDNLEQLQGIFGPEPTLSSNDTLPIIIQLQRKLTEAKYSVKCNEKTYKEFLNIHHLASYSLYEKFNSNVKDSLYKSELNKITDMLKVKTYKPWTKTCNGKLVIALDLVNENTETLDNVEILLHGTLPLSIVYTTKLFTKNDTPPFWVEEEIQKLKPNVLTTAIVIMDLNEVNNNTLSRIEFKGFIIFKKLGLKLLVPFDDIIVSSTDILTEDFDVLSDNKISDPKTTVALLATTKKTDICLRHIKNKDDSKISMLELFCKHLQMERITNMVNIIVHRASKYHILHGIMIVFPVTFSMKDSHTFLISLYTRSKSQVIALIHHIYNYLPTKVVITTPTFNITSKIEDLDLYNEEISINNKKNLKYNEYSSSVINKIDFVLQYLDYSIVKLNESKNTIVQCKVAEEINLFSGGVEKYLEFRDKLLEEETRGIEKFIRTDDVGKDFEAMVIDEIL